MEGIHLRFGIGWTPSPSRTYIHLQPQKVAFSGSRVSVDGMTGPRLPGLVLIQGQLSFYDMHMMAVRLEAQPQLPWPC